VATSQKWCRNAIKNTSSSLLHARRWRMCEQCRNMIKICLQLACMQGRQRCKHNRNATKPPLAHSCIRGRWRTHEWCRNAIKIHLREAQARFCTRGWWRMYCRGGTVWAMYHVVLCMVHERAAHVLTCFNVSRHWAAGKVGKGRRTNYGSPPCVPHGSPTPWVSPHVTHKPSWNPSTLMLGVTYIPWRGEAWAEASSGVGVPKENK
jgi:hypothetical protein